MYNICKLYIFIHFYKLSDMRNKQMEQVLIKIPTGSYHFSSAGLPFATSDCLYLRFRPLGIINDVNNYYTIQKQKHSSREASRLDRQAETAATLSSFHHPTFHINTVQTQNKTKT